MRKGRYGGQDLLASMSRTAWASSSPICFAARRIRGLPRPSRQILPDLAEDVVVAFSARSARRTALTPTHRGRRIPDGLTAAGPLGERLVPARLRLELKLLIERELSFERLLAVVERGHSSLHQKRVPWLGSASCVRSPRPPPAGAASTPQPPANQWLGRGVTMLTGRAIVKIVLPPASASVPLRSSNAWAGPAPRRMQK